MSNGDRHTIEPRAVAGGFVTALICVAGGLALALIGRALFDWSKSGTSRLAFFLAIIGFLLGGFRAGLLHPPAPLSNGGVAAMLAYVPLGIAQRVIAGKDLQLLSLVFATLLATSFGIFGGFVANNANRTRAQNRRGRPGL